MTNFDILILSNGPGEIVTWVIPVVEKVKSLLGEGFQNVRVSLILSPCPHSTGNEADVALGCDGIHRVQSADHFWRFLLWGKTADNWAWCKDGLVLFLGGDQFFTVVAAKRLGYRSVVYGEWDARWLRQIDHFAVMNSALKEKISPRFHHKVTVVGDLMADVPDVPLNDSDSDFCVGLLPGSKASKLTQGVPFLSAIAHYIHHKQPDIKFSIPVAPTISPKILASYGNKNNNKYVENFTDLSIELSTLDNFQFLQISNDLNITLITSFPCYDDIKNFDICLTTVGANTAQLASLNVPMIVVIPTYQLDAMKSWDGILGLLMNLPWLGNNFAKLINWLIINYSMRNKKLYAWPNIWAKKEIVPELIGHLKVEDIGDLILDYYYHPQKLQAIRQELSLVSKAKGARHKIAQIIIQYINQK
ncbi:lipid-A-disaccharide synthase [Cyanobacterium stanieri LEGE 03274]|uniref:Lipid-A-disaccharide synthase n=1 Tax=Cyanobacterium stanieri LEGE 03274 TaxID=1828756 RepID=A0ABR9V4B9_9CHRO|nr:lipid-A-disaccharide synthase [Cyanobacterium stanieri]MBE9222750.1 lipid-A-disaccharide synthase [Cyanobacterium stanieri LEGE 03274]